MKTDTHALVVLSGGQDSVTCLALALHRHRYVSAITFDYGQRHKKEVENASYIASSMLGMDHLVVDVSNVLQAVSPSALTDHSLDVSAKHKRLKHLPATFTPNRNALFLTIAHAHAQNIGATRIYTGVCQTDYSGYPDCRDHFIGSMQSTLASGSDAHIHIETPLMWINKAETWLLSQMLDAVLDEMDVMNTIIQHTLTCYNGDETMHEWGKGCGECPACVLRKEGWKTFRKMDFSDEQLNKVEKLINYC